MSSESVKGSGSEVNRLSDEQRKELRRTITEAVRKFNIEMEGYNLFKPHEKGILSVGFDSKDTISLHIKDVSGLDNLKEPTRAYERLLNEFRALAEVLKMEQDFSRVKEIVAHP